MRTEKQKKQKVFSAAVSPAPLMLCCLQRYHCSFLGITYCLSTPRILLHSSGHTCYTLVRGSDGIANRSMYRLFLIQQDKKERSTAPIRCSPVVSVLIRSTCEVLQELATPPWKSGTSRTYYLPGVSLLQLKTTGIYRRNRLDFPLE